MIQPDLNRALRSDVVRCTAWGIVDAVGRARWQQSAVAPTAASLADDARCRIHLPHAFSTRGFDCISYGVLTFARLRRLYGMHDNDYEHSFTRSAVGEAAVAERLTEGKSGSFFYFTADRRFLVKTVTRSECDFLRESLPAWLAHFSAHNGSLLTRYCGLHAIRLSPEQRWLRFCVMESAFAPGASYALGARYDLKGSWVNRRTRLRHGSDKAQDGTAGGGTRKDQDLQQPFAVAPAAADRLRAQLAVDATFLESLGAMDYSLLVGVLETGEGGDKPHEAAGAGAKAEAEAEAARNDANGTGEQAVGDDTAQLAALGLPTATAAVLGGDVVVCAGIVDVLQLYTLGKRLERWYKVCDTLHDRGNRGNREKGRGDTGGARAMYVVSCECIDLKVPDRGFVLFCHTSGSLAAP